MTWPRLPDILRFRRWSPGSTSCGNTPKLGARCSAIFAPQAFDLRASGFQVMLSLELSNRQYWKEDPLTVARTGLQKMKALVGASEQESS
ncbi:MAG: hypothetical protein JO114_01260 [Planctomycetaceae bacterium]|nr:hypothetical protein [Planctomycetaceae bacterium]